MKFTNKYKLPEVFVRAVKNDPYDKGKSDFSATGLAEPPRASALKAKFPDDLEVDVSSRVASIIGQGAHSIAERAQRPGVDLCEERFFADFIIDGIKYVISAQLDLYEKDSGAMYDWKTTKAYAFSKKAGSGQKPEWIQQLNVGAEILRRNEHNPKSLHIIALLKDFSDREMGRNGYPESEVMAVKLPMWTPAECTAYIEERVRLHVKAKLELPKCSSTDNWGSRKCGKWCDASKVCDQYKQAQATGLMTEGE